ncbi:tail assembly protein [Dickeya phage Sucellus]|nr:tail assembly protein [Dickeya phage Sucellus]
MATTKFILTGELGKKFGRQFDIKARNTSEAIKSMCYQLKGFRQYMETINIRIKISGKNVKGDCEMDAVKGLLFPVGANDTVIIAPVSGGRGNNILAGAFMVIAGIVAIVLAVPSGGSSLAAWSAASMALAASGAVMIIGGAAMMFTKTPTSSVSSTTSSTDSNTSFSQIDNLAGSGRPVPIAYGRNLVGSFVIQNSVETLPR